MARLKYLRSKGGEGPLEHVLAQLPPADAVTLRRPIRRDCWYPLSLQLRLDDAIASVVSPGERSDAFIEVGRAYADAILDRTQRQNVTSTAPKLFLESLPRLYRAYHTAGHREYEPVGQNAGIIRTFDANWRVPMDHCWTVVGCLQRGLELSGADTVLVTETSCRAVGASCCEYRCEWHGAEATTVGANC
ncbi:TIGR02265 family protein [Anaeromyxobacter oryzisoli]|uniref:TIGR02265 family protein n=1 Tax=Anaeromyxobacter oryzisoli TaxID=2925408 RepID=UPI001F56FA6A|nr:TIGR02265 family protein [Anaeromyxobacter sp. SG63]